MRILALAALGVLGALGACGGSNGTSGFGDGGASSGGNGNGNGNSSGAGASSSGTGTNLGGSLSDGGGAAGDGCSAAAKLVYVLSAENDLYSFDPPAKAFTKIGTLGCNTTLTPNSMAVSRDAVAWVNYISSDGTQGAIFNVSTSNASCTSTNVNLQSGWTQVGMGFSTDSATGTSETLYVAATGNGGIGLPPFPGFDAGLFGGGGSEGLGSLSTTTDVLTPIGAFSGSLAGQNAELTGTGDGRLFGFFVTSPTTQVAQIDKTSGATSNVVPMTGVEVPNYWAFSFWGGDFYLYTCPSDPSRTTNVTHYVPASGSTPATIDTAYMTNIGFRIVGAGVSTCAPTVEPPPQ